ncbi:hypothetical protein MZM54_03680 [[Brevibacterium] frigoritolerans]|nr:hypothetical protein [Peribacillus frigoritolerans]
MKENKVNTVRLTNYESTWINALRDLSETSVSHIRSLWYEDRFFDTDGSQWRTLVDKIRTDKEKEYEEYLEMALREFGKEKLIQLINIGCESVISIGFERKLTEEDAEFQYLKEKNVKKLRTYYACVYSTDINKTKSEFKEMLKKRYESGLEEYRKEIQQMEENQYIKITLEGKGLKYYQKLIDEIIGIYSGMKKDADEDEISRIMQDLRFYKNIKKQLSIGKKDSKTIFVHVLFEGAFTYIFEHIIESIEDMGMENIFKIDLSDFEPAWYEKNPEEYLAYFQKEFESWKELVKSYEPVINHFKKQIYDNKKSEEKLIKRILRESDELVASLKSFS